jgi:nitrogen fixation/metabolism regulation signal transduction histidine kinase
MLSKKLYINIIIRVLLITASSVLLGYSLISQDSIRLTIFSVLLLTILTVNLILFLNRTNRNIRFFFDSVKNDDSNLSFSVDNKSGSLKELHQSMNNVNLQIQKLKMENRQQEQFFSRILEMLATGIITYDSKGFIHHANSAAKKLLSVETMTHLGQIERIDNKLYTAIRSIRPSERHLVALKTKQGEIQLLLKSTISGTDKEELGILSIQDIKHELDEKEVDAWMKLIRVLMHEIMNSITPITSLSDSLIKIYHDGEKSISPEQLTGQKISTTLQGLTVIKQQGNGLMSFVDSYRKLTRIPDPDKKLFKVEDLITHVQLLYNSMQNNTGTGLSVDLKNPDLELYADQNLITQVLINLLKNALEANAGNKGAKISLVAGTDIFNHTEICVVDNGPGIAKEIIDEIFIPFFSTKQNGSGIGLSISKQIMRVHGGNLKARSIPGQETVFCMSF